MNTNDLLTTADALSDPDLLSRTHALAMSERETAVLLVAHLAALDRRPSAFAALGYGSLFAYCTRALRLSEDAACNRIEAARACRRFPTLLDHLATGEMSLTSVRKLGRRLTLENVEAVLARARQASLARIDALVAELAPRPDAPTLVRRLPSPVTRTVVPDSAPAFAPAAEVAPASAPSSSAAPVTVAPVTLPPASRPVIQVTSPQRYRVQFTVGEDTHTKLRRLQALLRREIPDGDPAAIVDRALTLLLEKVEKAKTGAASRPRPAPRIRPATDTSERSSRYIERHVQRTVWSRDGEQCAFVSEDGRRCTETTYLELHHVEPHALKGARTAGNISLRCRRHNQFEADQVFGPWRGTET